MSLKSCPLFQSLYKSHFNSYWSKIWQKCSSRVKLYGFRRILENIVVYESGLRSKSVYFLPLALFYWRFLQHSIFKKFAVKSRNFGHKLITIGGATFRPAPSSAGRIRAAPHGHTKETGRTLDGSARTSVRQTWGGRTDVRAANSTVHAAILIVHAAVRTSVRRRTDAGRTYCYLVLLL